MKLSQKKNCTGCKALTIDKGAPSCLLGCSQSISKSCVGRAIEFKPDVPCLKPMSNTDLIASTSLTGMTH